MRRPSTALPLLLCLLSVLLPARAWAAQALDTSVESGRGQLERITAGLDRPQQDDAALAAARDEVLAIQAAAQKLIDERAPQLESLDARLAELGDAAAAGEAAEVGRERKELQAQRSRLDAGLRQARLSVVESGQALEQIAARRQAMFHQTLSRRTTAPWRARFWSELGQSSNRDLSRLEALYREADKSVSGHWNAPTGVHPAWRVGVALLVLAGGWWLGRGWLPRLLANRLPAGRLRRSGPALARLLLASLSAWIGASLLRAALLPAVPPERVAALADLALGLVVFVVFVTTLGAVLLSTNKPSWRLPAISDAGARALRPFPLLAALAIAIAAFTQKTITLANASLALAVAGTVLAALLTTLVLLGLLLRVHRLQARLAVACAEGTQPPPFKPWMNLVLTLGWIAVTISLLGLLSGHVSLSGFIATQVLWTAIVGATAWLGMRFIDDLVCAVLGARGLAGRRINSRFGIDPRHVEQVAVLLSLGLRMALALVALIALAVPYGASGDDLIGRTLGLLGGITIGELVLSPRNVVRALLVFALASLGFRLFQRWLARRYLPTTQMDEGMRASVATLFGYVGLVLAVAMALAAIGVGLERIAWIASALSVGIGFGLQAIVQNFISGLILLAERPVKVGDWVIVGDAEGDIRRINVRATEIQTGDRTTVLVPNSEFITKTVRNRTFSNSSEGLVKIVLPMPLTTDADLVRELLLEAFREHPGILEAPAPNVQLDGIDNGRVVFSATGYVSTPRQAGAARSALLFEILRKLRQLNIRMV